MNGFRWTMFRDNVFAISPRQIWTEVLLINKMLVKTLPVWSSRRCWDDQSLTLSESVDQPQVHKSHASVHFFFFWKYLRHVPFLKLYPYNIYKRFHCRFEFIFMMLCLFSQTFLANQPKPHVSQTLFFCITCFSHLALITCSIRLEQF